MMKNIDYSIEMLGSNIGPNMLQKIKEAGYTDYRDIAILKVPEFEAITGIGGKIAQKTLQAARDKLPYYFERTSARLTHRKETLASQLSSGCQSFDELLRGGLTRGTLNQISATQSTDSTLFCYQMALQATLPVSKGGLGKNTLWIDTVDHFQDREVAQLAFHRGMDPEIALRRMYFGRAYNSEDQVYQITKAVTQAREMNLGLIVIDSLTAHFREEFRGSDLKTIVTRQQQLGQHLAYFKRALAVKGLIGLVTNRIHTRPDLSAEGLIPIGGQTVGLIMNNMFHLTTEGQVRKLQVLKGCDLAENATYATLTEAGFIS